PRCERSGTAVWDEILFAAHPCAVRLTEALSDDEIETLRRATVETLEEWTQRLRAEVGEAFPDKVTAFHEQMAVHGRYGQPCRVCGTKIQRIRYAANEVNYCPRCQTGG